MPNTNTSSGAEFYICGCVKGYSIDPADSFKCLPNESDQASIKTAGGLSPLSTPGFDDKSFDIVQYSPGSAVLWMASVAFLMAASAAFILLIYSMVIKGAKLKLRLVPDCSRFLFLTGASALCFAFLPSTTLPTFESVLLQQRLEAPAACAQDHGCQQLCFTPIRGFMPPPALNRTRFKEQAYAPKTYRTKSLNNTTATVRIPDIRLTMSLNEAGDTAMQSALSVALCTAVGSPTPRMCRVRSLQQSGEFASVGFVVIVENATSSVYDMAAYLTAVVEDAAASGALMAHIKREAAANGILTEKLVSMPEQLLMQSAFSDGVSSFAHVAGVGYG